MRRSPLVDIERSGVVSAARWRHSYDSTLIEHFNIDAYRQFALASVAVTSTRGAPERWWRISTWGRVLVGVFALVVGTYCSYDATRQSSE